VRESSNCNRLVAAVKENLRGRQSVEDDLLLVHTQHAGRNINCDIQEAMHIRARAVTLQAKRMFVNKEKCRDSFMGLLTMPKKQGSL
jgi:hypothetical protein